MKNNIGFKQQTVYTEFIPRIPLKFPSNVNNQVANIWR